MTKAKKQKNILVKQEIIKKAKIMLIGILIALNIFMGHLCYGSMKDYSELSKSQYKDFEKPSIMFTVVAAVISDWDN